MSGKKRPSPTALFNLNAPLLLRRRGIWHVCFWCGYVLYEVLAYGLMDNHYVRHLVVVMLSLPFKVAATYFTLYILIDRYLIAGRYGSFILLLILSMALFPILSRAMFWYVSFPDDLSLINPDSLFYPPKLLIALFNIYSLVAILASFHLIRLRHHHQQTLRRLELSTEMLEKEKRAADLQLLKMQINPHFLFNTLNNLYALALKKSDRAPEVIYKLSELMSYMLHDVNRREVSLKDEVEYIQNYIALEKIRCDDKLNVQFRVHDNIEGVLVAPLLILPFVENSFKHGLRAGFSNSWVRINLRFRDNHLLLKVENSKPSVCAAAPGSPGLGLKNIGRRLDFIYPGRYSLDCRDLGATFLVLLNVQIVKPGAGSGLGTRKRTHVTLG